MRAFFAFSMLTVSLAPSFAASGLQCSAFLHERSGSWRSLEQSDVLGPDGVVHFKVGERISPTDGSSKGDIARALNEICAK